MSQNLPALKHPGPAPLYTAEQIARAIGPSVKTSDIVLLLASIPADGYRSIGRHEARAFHLASLPAALLALIAPVAAQRGFSNLATFLSDPAPIWQPRIPLSLTHPDNVSDAIKLQKALADALARKDDNSICAAERDAAGVESYRREFGYAITTRHWRRLFQRTLERDNGANQWSRVDIYMGDNIGPAATPSTPIKEQDYPAILDAVATLENKAKPTTADRTHLFHAALTDYERLTEGHDKPSRRLTKNNLLAFLLSAVPGLAKSAKSLRTVFDLNLRLWREHGRDIAAMEDQRHLKSGRTRPHFPDDQKKIVDLAILHGGNEALAHRVLRQRGELSQEFCAHYGFDPRSNKSYVPPAVRSDITPDVDMCGPIHRGPWEAKMRGPYIPRDWSGVAPGDYFSADDWTPNHYFWCDDENGKPQIHRGECLLMIDLRTGYILDYLLIAGKYNSRHVLQLKLRVHDRQGLPHFGYYYENGVWKARLIEAIGEKFTMPWRDVEAGLQRPGLGLTIRHATTPRAKTIEGIIRILQERQRSEPNFVGFNERLENMERVQEKILRVRNGKAHPREHFLEMSEWGQRLDAACVEYNNDPQNGKMLEGSSPSEAWQAGLAQKPLRKLADDARYLLATHNKPVKVRQEGIVLTINGKKFLYASEQTGKLIGREIMAYWNVECPELLTVSDMKRQNYFAVKAISLPAMSATKEQFQAVHEQISGHRQAAKTIYSNIRHPVISTISRDNDHDATTRELGRFHNAAVAAHEEEQTAQTRKLRKVHLAAAANGNAITHRVRNPDRVLQGQELERQALALLAAGADTGATNKSP